MAARKQQDNEPLQDNQPIDEAPAQTAPAKTASVTPRMTGVITILEDGTVATNGVTTENAAAMAKLMLRIAAELVEVSAAGGTS